MFTFHQEVLSMNLADFITKVRNNPNIDLSFIYTLSIIVTEQDIFLLSDVNTVNQIYASFKYIGHGKEYEFILQDVGDDFEAEDPSERTNLLHQLLFILLTAWFRSQVVCNALCLMNVPLEILERAVRFVPEWQKSIGTLRKLNFNIQESEDRKQREENYMFLDRLLRKTSNLRVLEIDVIEATEEQTVRHICLGGQRFPHLTSCTLKNVMIEAFDFTNLTETNADKLELLRLENVELMEDPISANPKNLDMIRAFSYDAEPTNSLEFQGCMLKEGNWRELFYSMGCSKLKRCQFEFADLHDKKDCYYNTIVKADWEEKSAARKLETYMREGTGFPSEYQLDILGSGRIYLIAK